MAKATVTITKTLDATWGVDDLLEVCDDMEHVERELLEMMQDDLSAVIHGATWDIQIEEGAG